MAYTSLLDQVVNSSQPSLGPTWSQQFLNNAITDALLAIPAVDTVYVSHDSDAVKVWTIVDDPAEYVYDQIYDAERSIIRRFRSSTFDFIVVPRKGRDTRSIITLNCPGWSRYAALPQLSHAGR